jgi:IclR family acetate operon transcriptional repressor
MPAERRSTTIQSVQRASRIIRAVAAAPNGLAAQEVAVQFGLTLSTAYHLLSTLAEEGMLAKVAGRRYVLGWAAGEVANSVDRGLRPPASHLAALNHVAEETGETAYLTAWRLGSIRILATVEGAHAVRVAGLDVGFVGSIHARASGKLLLAYADPPDRESALSRCAFERHTPHTIVNRQALDEDLARIRVEGLGRDRQEFREGVYSVSAPIRHDGAVVAALALSAPVQRFLERESEIVAALRSAAEEAGKGVVDRVG